MAYQNVGTPRFYVNILEYLGTIGYTEIEDVHRTNPTSIKLAELDINDDAVKITTSVPEGIFGEKSFVAFLGHSRGSLRIFGTWFSSDISINANFSEGGTSALDPEYSGFSIASFDGRDIEDEIKISHEHDIGSIVAGSYYDMPHSSDLNLKLSYEYDGVKTIQTKGGATLSNASYTKPADWGDRGAWQLGDIIGVPISNLRSGRRVWDLSFSYLSDSDLFPSVAATTNYEAGDSFVPNNPQDNTLIEGTDFFSVVWNKTLAGHLPFIFQPNGSNNNPDQFCIARFDMESLQYDQAANNVYNVKLKIREVW